MTILTLQGLWPTHHGDLTQLVNSRYCVLVLCVLAVSHVTMVSVYYQSPIQCFCPGYLDSSQCNMIKVHCLIKDPSKLRTDFSVGTERIPVSMIYYNHVSLILLLQALLFYIPSVIWRELARKSGFLPEELSLSALETGRIKDVHDKESAIQDIASSVTDFCMRQMQKRHLSYAFGWFHGNQLVVSRLFSKVIYTANVFGQFFMLDAFLGMPFHSLGWQIMGRSQAVGYWTEYLWSTALIEVNNYKNGSIQDDVDGISENYTLSHLDSVTFHRDVLCDFKTPSFRGPRQHLVHCQLPVNYLNELLFTYVWFLLCSVSVVTITSLSVSTFQLFIFPCRRMGIRERLQNIGTLEWNDPSDSVTAKKIDLFEKDFLQRDGLLLFGYIEAGAGDLLTDKVLRLLWESYEETVSDIELIVQPVKWTEQFVEVIDEIPASDQTAREVDSTTVFIPMQARTLELEFDVPPSYDDIGSTRATPYPEFETKDLNDEYEAKGATPI